MAEFDFSQAIADVRAKYGSIAKALDVERMKADIAELERQAAAPGLWDDPENAQKVTSRLSAAESQLKRLTSAASRIDDVETLVELGREEGDQDSLDEAQAEVASIAQDLDQMEIQTLLDGEYDERSAVVTVRAGAGGVVLKHAKQETVVFEPEFEPQFEGDRNLPYTVENPEPHVFVVEGPRIEKMLGYTNLDSEKGFDFFQKFLKNSGILDELEKAGIEEGDTVRMYGLAFDYY